MSKFQNYTQSQLCPEVDIHLYKHKCHGNLGFKMICLSCLNGWLSWKSNRLLILGSWVQVSTVDNEVFQISVQKFLMHYAKFWNKTPNKTVALRMRKLVRMSSNHQGLPLIWNCLNTSFTVHSEVSFMWLWTEMVPHQGRIKLQLLKRRKALWSEKMKIDLFGHHDEE